jgi:hypothetical protein
MSGTNLKWKSNTVNEILSNFKPEMDFYFRTSARLFPSSEITWRVLATVKNSALNAVFPITLRSQFPIWVSQKIVKNMFITTFAQNYSQNAGNAISKTQKF